MRLTKLLFACLMQFCLGQGGGATEEVKQKYALVFTSDVYTCPDDDTASFIDTSNLHTIRVNESLAILTGDFTFHKDTGPYLVADIKLYKEVNGYNNVVITDEICDLCSECKPKDESNPYISYLKRLEFPDECPIPAGTYVVNDLAADLGVFEVNAASAGKYHATIDMYTSPEDNCQDRTFMGCLMLDLSVEPEED